MKKRNIKDLLGKKFSRLTIISEAEPFPSGGRNYRGVLCRCDCGTQKPVRLYEVTSGNTQSCGCLINERIREAITTHGDTSGYKHSSEYLSWTAMRARCLNPKSAKYPTYGARGISVCDRWKNSFINFLEDMGRKPTTKHTLDRWPDRGGNYEPSNCRWATPKEQAKNRSRCGPVGISITFRGETKTPLEWARLLKIPSTTIRERLKAGWSAEDALTTHVKPRKNLHKIIR